MEKEQQLEDMLKKDGERTPSSDLFRELADPEFRYLYARAIKSTDGQLIADLGDWIIQGVKGEFYPVKNDIFEMTYELVSEVSNE